MFKDLKEIIVNVVKSRLFVMILVFIALFAILINRLFVLQIVKGEEYLNNFILKIEKEKNIASTRGNIFDRNGILLASNELAYSVTLEDTYAPVTGKNEELNGTIYKVIKIIEENGDHIVNDFNIILDSSNNYVFSLEDKQLLRFLADVYGHTKIEDLKYNNRLKYNERNATPEQVIEYLAGENKFGIGEYAGDGKDKRFVIGKGYSKEELLQILTIRYALSLNSFQKFIATTIATSVKEETVAVIMENKSSLQGVDIAESTVRKYNDSIYFAPIMGYTGKISQEEYDVYKETNDNYSLTDMVGKSGIEYVMEGQLQGTKGKQKVYVDNMGKVIEIADEKINAVAGNDLYLTIDAELQKAVYKIIEQKLAGILVSKIKDIKTFTLPPNGNASDIQIPIDDVYFALINNNIIDINHFKEDTASTAERAIEEKFQSKKSSVISKIMQELQSDLPTAYENLTLEMKVYESFIATMLGRNNLGVILESDIDTSDSVYKAWRAETIGLKDYLEHIINMNWIDITKLDVQSKYSDSSEIYNALLTYIEEKLNGSLIVKENSGNNTSFAKKIYKYMIADNLISGREICNVLYDQEILSSEDEDKDRLLNGSISTYNFMLEKIKKLEITPAQLALDPCSASVVVTDPNTGEVLAMVSYPSFDNNRLANTVDSNYYNQLLNDLSRPLYNNATQQKTAPGSTLKPLTVVAGLEEGVISTSDTITCRGVFDTIKGSEIKCWIYPRGTHGSLNAVGGLKNSCNIFMNEVAYRLSYNTAAKRYDEKQGIETLAKYAEMFGLGEPSGMEVTEAEPQISTEYPLTSAMGQGNHNFTTSQLSRYLTTIANKGTCFNLSLLKKVTKSDGTLVEEFTPSVYNNVELADSTWSTVQEGMREAAAGYNSFKLLPSLSVAGKTGTAEEKKTRANHALFIGFAPFDNPEITVATRIAFGYSSSNAAEISRDVFKYCLEISEEDELVNGVAQTPDSLDVGGW